MKKVIANPQQRHWRSLTHLLDGCPMRQNIVTQIRLQRMNGQNMEVVLVGVKNIFINVSYFFFFAQTEKKKEEN